MKYEYNTKSDNELLKYLAKAIRDNPRLSGVRFDCLLDRPANERTYRTRFGTWKNAKVLANKTKTHFFFDSPKRQKRDDKIEIIPPEKLADKTGAYPLSESVATWQEADNPERDLTIDGLKRTVVRLQRENAKLYKKQLTMAEVREQIFGLKEAKVEIPEWFTRVPAKSSGHGVPALMLSDFHLGEVIEPEQVFNTNEFNLSIAEDRVQLLAEHTIDILTNHLKAQHPGIVVLLNGDFVAGCIHEELLITNEQPIMPVVIRAYEMLVWLIEEIRMFIGNIQVFCCHGNHSRTFKKPIYKNSALSSYDWLIYTLLDRYFQNNSEVNFVIAPSDDVQFRIYNHRYRMTHGGQFRGGQGFLGHIAPVTRGEIRKRTAAESYGMDYDTLLIGHFHTYSHFKRVICNGSLVGYSEYSMNNNYPYERPQQALWFTHPDNGITFNVPIFCTKEKQLKKPKWVSWKE